MPFWYDNGLDRIKFPPVYLLYESTLQLNSRSDICSSREVEGNGPVKPGNPRAKPHEGCQFRRSCPQDEGKSDDARTPEMQGYFIACTFI